MTRFLLDTHRDNQETVVVLGGDLDMESAPTLLAAASAALTQADVISLRLDMSEVSFLDSSGLGVLATIHQDATERRKSMIVWNPKPASRRAIEIVGMHTLLMIEPIEG